MDYYSDQEWPWHCPITRLDDKGWINPWTGWTELWKWGLRYSRMPNETRKDRLPSVGFLRSQLCEKIFWKEGLLLNLLCTTVSVKTKGIFTLGLSKILNSLYLSSEYMWVCARKGAKPWHVSRGAVALVGASALGSVHKSRIPPRPSTFWYAISGVFFYLFSSLLETPFFFTFLHGSASEHQIFLDLRWMFLGLRLMILWWSLSGRLFMRGSSRVGGLHSLPRIGPTLSSFSKMPLCSFTLLWIGTYWRP